VVLLASITFNSPAPLLMLNLQPAPSHGAGFCIVLPLREGRSRGYRNVKLSNPTSAIKLIAAMTMKPRSTMLMGSPLPVTNPATSCPEPLLLTFQN
jgi:hypothetical protein